MRHHAKVPTRLGSIFLLLACASTAFAAEEPPSDTWRLTLRGFGPIRYGMTIEQASAILGERLLVEPKDRADCNYVSWPSMPEGVAFMTVDGIIGRIDVTEEGPRTLSGAHVGSTEAEVRRLYPGQIRTKSHPYTGPEGHYLILIPHDPSNASFGMIFETDGKRVLTFRAGYGGSVGAIEGCD